MHSRTSNQLKTSLITVLVHYNLSKSNLNNNWNVIDSLAANFKTVVVRRLKNSNRAAKYDPKKEITLLKLFVYGAQVAKSLTLKAE